MTTRLSGAAGSPRTTKTLPSSPSTRSWVKREMSDSRMSKPSTATFSEAVSKATLAVMPGSCVVKKR